MEEKKIGLRKWGPKKISKSTLYRSSAISIYFFRHQKNIKFLNCAGKEGKEKRDDVLLLYRQFIHR